MSSHLKRMLLGVAAAVAILAIPTAAQAHYVGTFVVLNTVPSNQQPWDNPGPNDSAGASNCHLGYWCAWYSQNFAGWGVGFYYDKWDYAASDVPKNGSASINNHTNSVWNRGYPGSYDDVRMYNYAGGNMAPGDAWTYCIPNGLYFTAPIGPHALYQTSAHVWVNSC